MRRPMAALAATGQVTVIDAEQMEQRGVEVTHLDRGPPSGQMPRDWRPVLQRRYPVSDRNTVIPHTRAECQFHILKLQKG